jgi:hypothetical protein
MSAVRIEPCPYGLRLVRDIDGVGTRGFCEVHGMFLKKQSNGRVLAQREAFPREIINEAYWGAPRRRAVQRLLSAPKESVLQLPDFHRSRSSARLAGGKRI